MSEPSKWAKKEALDLSVEIDAQWEYDDKEVLDTVAQALDAARREGCRIGLEAATQSILSPSAGTIDGMAGAERFAFEYAGEVVRSLDPDQILRERDEGE